MSDLPQKPSHPKLNEKEADLQRGSDPPNPVGNTRKPDAGRDPDPGFVPPPGRADHWRGQAAEIGHEHRPNREDVLPYLLIRAFTPGDRGGQRPLWQPIVSWESPDILLIDATYTGPFDPARLVVSPIAGRAYRVFVRVWNLGLFPAVGVHVRAWAINPGFFGAGNHNDPYYRQNLIGGAWITELTDRRQPGCTALAELDRPWRISEKETGHECLIAAVTCPADHYDGPLLANERRHVAQRNLWINPPAAGLAPLIALVPKGFTLELTHGGPAVLPLLQALGGGALPIGDKRVRIVPPRLEDIRAGVRIGASAHLLTAFESDGRTVLARSPALWKTMGRTRFARSSLDSPPGTHPFAEPGGTRRLLEILGPDRWPEVATITDAPLNRAFPELLQRMIADGLGGPKNAHHLLRLTLSTPDGTLIGGYSIVITR